MNSFIPKRSIGLEDTEADAGIPIQGRQPRTETVEEADQNGCTENVEGQVQEEMIEKDQDSESNGEKEATANGTEMPLFVAELVTNDVNDVSAVVARQVAERLASERLRLQKERDQTPLVHGVAILEEVDNSVTKSGTPQKEDSNTKLICGMKPFVVGVLLVSVLVIGVVLAVVFSGGEKDEKSQIVPPALSPSPNPTAQPTTIPNPRRVHLEQILEERVSTLIPLTEWWALLDDPNSAESQALTWMSAEDNYYVDLGSIEPQFLAERFALAVFYYATSGSSWNYDFPYLDNSSSVCDWNNKEHVGNDGTNGAYCTDDADKVGIVTYLDLHDIRLLGTIPWEIGLLNSLTSLYMESNMLSGIIPTQLNELSSLRKVWIQGNQLTGQIPEHLPSTLEHLFLNENDLSGTMASDWAGMMPSLDLFAIEFNRFHGTIPTEMGLLTKLSWLEINDNDITGTIPTEIGLLTSLTYLWMNGNSLTGTLPSQIADITDLQYFWLQENEYLTGTIPVAFGELANLKQFYFHYTALTGSVDSIFCMVAGSTPPTLIGDCLGANPEMECSCCAYCCPRDRTGCVDMLQ